MSKNKLYIAGAGSWKTTFLVKEALKIRKGRVLITTYTEANEDEIGKKFIEINGCIPWNVVIQTWFSFLLRHWVRPFQSVIDDSIDKMDIWFLLVSEKSWCRGKRGWYPTYWGEDEPIRYYFGNGKIFSDKISKFVYECNLRTKGAVISRIGKIFDHIFIDEVQDLVGWDLELLKLFFISDSFVFLAGDPRQVTYLTHPSSKHPKYKHGLIWNFFLNECRGLSFDIDEVTLRDSHRNNQKICEYSSLLFPEFEKCSSCQCEKCRTEDLWHSGIFIIRPEDVLNYKERYSPVILKDKLAVSPEWNFWKSKWLTFDRTLIYPTKPMIAWMKNHSNELEPMSRCKFYVALTRARHSVWIVVNTDDIRDIRDLPLFAPVV